MSILLIQADAAPSDQPLLLNKTLLLSHPPASLLPSHPLRNYRFALRRPGNSLSLHPPTQTHTFISNDHECKLGSTRALTLLTISAAPSRGRSHSVSVVCPLLFVCLCAAHGCFSKIHFISLISVNKLHFFGYKCDIQSAPSNSYQTLR